MAQDAKKRLELPNDSKDLMALCREAGWTEGRETKSGTKFVSRNGQTVIIGNRLAYHALGNTHAALRRAGIEEDIEEAREEAEARRRAALAAAPKAVGRKAAAKPNGQAKQPPGPPVVVSFSGLGNTNANTPAAKPGNETPSGAAVIDEVVGDDMVTETILVTPELALEWLDRDPPHLPDGTVIRQRPRREAHVLWLAEQMDTPGAWKVTPQGVALAPTVGNSGGVLDGQHRLAAVVVCGTPQLMRVTFNVPTEVFAVLDTGKNRGAGDVLAITGYNNTFHLGSVAKLACVWQRWLHDRSGPLRDWRVWNRQKITNQDILELVQSWPGIYDEMKATYPYCGEPVGLNLAAATVFRLWAVQEWPECGLPRDDAGNPVHDADTQPDGSPLKQSILDEWMHRLRHGYNLDEGNPILTLRNWISTKKHKKDLPGAIRELTLFGMIKAWNNYHRDIPMEIMRIGPKEYMPTPYSPPPAK